MKKCFYYFYFLSTIIILTITVACDNNNEYYMNEDESNIKTLIILRHAKSCWETPVKSDFDRPLNKRGYKNAPFMAKVFKDLNIPIDLIISSPANRAITTAKIFSDEIGYPTEKIIKDMSIYEAGLSDLISLLKETDNKYNNVMIVGHNNAFTDLANYLTDESIDNIFTCGIVGISFNGTWQEVDNVECTFLFFEYPKKYD